jgi:hypothetical protein
MPRSRRRPHQLFAIAACCIALTACGGSPVDPNGLLTKAKQVIDGSQSVHFTLSSSSVSGSGPLIVGGSGDLLRPDSFHGSLQVLDSGFTLNVDAVSVGGTFYVHLPISPGYQVTSPSDYGFADPGQLMDPNHGLSSLLLQCQGTALRDDDRLSGEQLHEVSCSLPGSVIARLLTDAQPSQPVSAKFGINGDSGQLRRVVLTGPFYTATSTTFTLIVDHYGESVTITAPPG